MYCAPAVQTPDQEQIKQLARDLKFNIPDDQIQDYHNVVSNALKAYSVLEKYVEPSLPVKYPRTPGYRPSQEDNRYNAWYYKTNIPGAASGPLLGYKVAIKDSIPVAGVPMMNGSRVTEGYVPDYDPTIVTRLLDAGATIMGKAVCEDMCYCGRSFTSHPAPVLNPHDTTRTSGGSSSGSAVLVQVGDVDLAVGADQAGSIRIPASWTGIIGLKPTYGLVPYTGISSMTPAIDHPGPMARTVRDCALMLEVMAGDDGGLDMRQRNIPTRDQIPKYSQLLTDKLEGIKIGLLKEGFMACRAGVEDTVKEAALKLEQQGASVGDISIPMHTDAPALFTPIINEGMYQVMIQSQGYSVGPPSFYSTSAIDNAFASQTARVKDMPETTKPMLLAGKYMLDNYGMRFYGKSQNLFRLLKEKYDEALQQYDVLVMPTLKRTAPKMLSDDSTLAERLVASTDMLANTAPFDGTGHPALSINAGFLDGLPVGMMIVGKHLAEQTIFNVAHAFEQIRDAEKP